jgi:tetratricopeptide (TPR) repeat protein
MVNVEDSSCERAAVYDPRMSADRLCACLAILLSMGGGAKATGQENAAELAQRAAALREKGDNAGAAEAFHAALVRAPGSEQLWAKWADFALERFRILELELRGSQKGMAAILRLQAEGLHGGKESREEFLRQSAIADSEQEGIWGELGIEQLQQGKREEARVTLKTAREQQPRELWTLRLEALVAAAEGNWTEGETHLLELGGRSPAVLRSTMQSWPRKLVPQENVPGEVWQCMRKNSMTCLDRITSREAEAPQEEEQLFVEQRWEKLAGLPEQPTAPLAWFRVGFALAELKDCTRAIPALERGLEAGAETAAYWLERCYAAEAERAVGRIGALGDEALFHCVNGDFLVRVRDEAQAATEEYAKAKQLQPQNAAFAERLAQAYMSLGELQQAQQAAREALAIDPHRPMALRLLASIAMNERDYQDAIVFLSRKLRMTPTDGWTRAQMGIAYAETGRPLQALQYLQLALTAGYPDERGALHAMLARELRKLGREQEAQDAAAESRRLSDRFQLHPQKGADDHQ